LDDVDAEDEAGKVGMPLHLLAAREEAGVDEDVDAEGGSLRVRLFAAGMETEIAAREDELSVRGREEDAVAGVKVDVEDDVVL